MVTTRVLRRTTASFNACYAEYQGTCTCRYIHLCTTQHTHTHTYTHAHTHTHTHTQTVAAMKFNENLQELWLGCNHLGPEDGQHLGSILRTNHTLRILDVRENNLQVTTLALIYHNVQCTAQITTVLSNCCYTTLMAT